MFRHTMATLMLEGEADIRFIKQMLGQAEMSTTQIYTQVSILKLQQVHALTHPPEQGRAAAALAKDASAPGQGYEEQEFLSS